MDELLNFWDDVISHHPSEAEAVANDLLYYLTSRENEGYYYRFDHDHNLILTGKGEILKTLIELLAELKN